MGDRAPARDQRRRPVPGHRHLLLGRGDPLAADPRLERADQSGPSQGCARSSTARGDRRRGGAGGGDLAPAGVLRPGRRRYRHRRRARRRWPRSATRAGWSSSRTCCPIRPTRSSRPIDQRRNREYLQRAWPLSPVRIALVGAGRMGSVHLGALRASREIELVGVVEPFDATRRRVAAGGAHVYAGVDELLAQDPPPEAVLIAAPSDSAPRAGGPLRRRRHPDAV